MQTAYNTLNGLINGSSIVILNNGAAWYNGADLKYNLGYNRMAALYYQDQNGSGTLALKYVVFCTARDSSHSRYISRTVIDAGNDFDTGSAITSLNSGTYVGVHNASGYTLYPKVRLFILA